MYFSLAKKTEILLYFIWVYCFNRYGMLSLNHGNWFIIVISHNGPIYRFIIVYNFLYTG